MRAYLQNLKAQIKLNDEATVTSTGDPLGGIAPVSGSDRRVEKEDRGKKSSSDSDSSSDDGSSSDSSDSSSESD